MHRGRDPLRGRSAFEGDPSGRGPGQDRRQGRVVAGPAVAGRADHPRSGSRRVTQEDARDLVRAREDARGDLMRARHRVSKLLLRHGHVYYGGRAWTGKHRAWLRLGPVRPARHPGRLRGRPWRPSSSPWPAGPAWTPRSPRWPRTREFTAMTRRLCCLRGISTLTGFALAVEIGEWDRFTGSSIGAYLGLVPSEHSTGESRRQGGITKTGNTHVRRLLVEAAWHHQRRYTVGAGPPGPLGPGHPRGTGPRPRRQPAAAPPMGPLHRTRQEAHRGQHRHRPRARRLVLVPGHPGVANSTARPGLARTRCAQREEPTRDSTVSHQPQDGDARHQRKRSAPAERRPAVTNPRISVLTVRRKDTLRKATTRPRRTRCRRINQTRRHLTLPLDRNPTYQSRRAGLARGTAGRGGRGHPRGAPADRRRSAADPAAAQADARHPGSLRREDVPRRVTHGDARLATGTLDGGAHEVRLPACWPPRRRWSRPRTAWRARR